MTEGLTLVIVQCVLEFPLACGITVGTPVRIRGVPVGSVLSVNPSLEKVEVLVEVRLHPFLLWPHLCLLHSTWICLLAAIGALFILFP